MNVLNFPPPKRHLRADLLEGLNAQATYAFGTPYQWVELSISNGTFTGPFICLQNRSGILHRTFCPEVSDQLDIDLEKLRLDPTKANYHIWQSLQRLYFLNFPKEK